MEKFIDFKVRKIPEHDFETIVDWVVRDSDISKRGMNAFAGASIWGRVTTDKLFNYDVTEVSLDDLKYVMSFVRNGEHTISMNGQCKFLESILDSLDKDQLEYIRS